MSHTRREMLGIGGAALAGLGGMTIMPFAARAQGGLIQGDAYATDGGEIVVHPVSHASFVLQTPGLVIYNDPVGGAEAYAGLPAPQLILVSHEHGDHFDLPTLTALAGDETRLLTNPAVYAMLPAELQAKATAIANGEATTVNDLGIEAIPAYNTTPERMQYHPQGRDNGYVLSVDGLRVYIAGDTEDIPEMRALRDIDVAFVPMILPYTMTVEQAAAGVDAFRPAIVYPYHYVDSDVAAFSRLLADAGAPTRVVLGQWY